MLEAKPIASLTPGLLARKGDARPAVRRAYMPVTAIAPLPVSLQKDMIDAPAQPSRKIPVARNAEPVPLTLVVRQMQDRIARTLTTPAQHGEEAAESRKARIAFTLRIEPERHQRLRAAKQASHRSAQQIVTQALDEFLARQPGLGEPAGAPDGSVKAG